MTTSYFRLGTGSRQAGAHLRLWLAALRNRLNAEYFFIGLRLPDIQHRHKDSYRYYVSLAPLTSRSRSFFVSNGLSGTTIAA